jgi:DNA-binding NarL/FixJ family response regulator
MSSSVLLAVEHLGLVEGIRSLLSAEFETVVMVADERSLYETAERLCPRLAVLDLALAHGDIAGLLHRLRLHYAGLKVIALSSVVEPAMAQAAMEAGADGLVSWRAIATDLFATVDDVLRRDRPQHSQ